jgi:hypothetical protein
MIMRRPVAYRAGVFAVLFCKLFIVSLNLAEVSAAGPYITSWNPGVIFFGHLPGRSANLGAFDQSHRMHARLHFIFAHSLSAITNNPPGPSVPFLLSVPCARSDRAGMTKTKTTITSPP